MMTFVPILPLKSMVYPGEKLNLKLTDKAMIQLVRDCLDAQKHFGIFYPDEKNRYKPMGTVATVVEIARTLKNGAVYVRVKGLKACRILETKDNIPDKTYHGAIIEYLVETAVNVTENTRTLILSEVQRLYKLLHLEKKFPTKLDNVTSYALAHKIGFNAAQEYELLTITNEMQRMEYIRRHLNAMMPVVRELETMKKRIQMNGHFRNIS